ncbi:hypothetical protein B5F39_06830 [Cloacibacillus sp. An23]|nr:hypothetical protein B5F39_06830 [Cloacibacillus sp. An23]
MRARRRPSASRRRETRAPEFAKKPAPSMCHDAAFAAKGRRAPALYRQRVRAPKFAVPKPTAQII